MCRRAIDHLVQFSTCAAPVLIVGESGTDKELAARAVHYLGARCDRAFIPVNCGSLPDGLIETEFYGHTRGAFTDAGHARRGLVQQAIQDRGARYVAEYKYLSSKDLLFRVNKAVNAPLAFMRPGGACLGRQGRAKS